MSINDHIAHDVLAQGLLLTGLGAAIGIAGTLAGARLIASILYGVRATDIVAFLAASLVLVTAAPVASYTPPRRAMRVDPMVALRYE